jgi:hypothetical protein
MIDAELHTVNIKNMSTQVRLPLAAPPGNLRVDPNINLLASFTFPTASK